MSSLNSKFCFSPTGDLLIWSYKFYTSYFLLFIICLISTSLAAQNIYLHSHNDYEQDRPLHEAIDLQYNSIEIDIVAYKDQLKVSHDTKNLKDKPTLEEAYLDKLVTLITQDSFQYDLPIILLLDFKEYDDQSLLLLHKSLENYDLLLMNIHNTAIKPLQVLLSGDIPRKKIIHDKRFKYFFIDGRLSDLRKNYSSFIMPWISHDFSKLTDWKGKKDISLKDEIKIKNAIFSVQNQNKKIRFWKTAENEKLWDFLYRKKVDIISTDELETLSQFIYSL